MVLGSRTPGCRRAGQETARGQFLARSVCVCVWLLALGCRVALADGVTVRLPIVVAAEAGRREAAVLTVAAGGEPVLRVEVGTRRTQWGAASAAARPMRFDRRLHPGRHEVQVKLRDGTAALCIDHEQWGVLHDVSIAGRVTASFEPTQSIAATEPPRAQRVGALAFADDFAREAAAESQWETLSGRFVLNSSLNPGSALGAFQMWASAPAEQGLALASASRWFWDDMLCGVSAMAPALPATWGLVLHWTAADSCHLVSWQQESGDRPGTVRLVRRRGGSEAVLAEVPLTMLPSQWYRLSVLSRGRTARIFVGGNEVARVEDPHLTGGRLGLLVENTGEVAFDDVSAVAAGPETEAETWQHPLPFGPAEQPWSDFSKTSFFSDPFMVQWAHPRSFWEWDSAARLHWFRSRFFHDVRLTWTAPPGRPLVPDERETAIAIFTDRDSTSPSGYRVTFDSTAVHLTRGAERVTSAPRPAAPIEALHLHVADGRVALTLNDGEVLRWQDPAPLRKGDVGMHLGRTAGTRLDRPDWRDTARLESTHRLDYGFDSAPTAWAVGAGQWQGTHRWACVPKWSFLGGRGDPGPAEDSHGMALLWNLRRFAGDFDLEVFAAPMEGTPQRVHFAYPVSLNVAFLADGVNLDSGCLLQFGTYDIPTRLFREGTLIGEWDGRVNPALRRQTNPWYNRMTRVWQHLRIQRRGNTIMVDAARHDDHANTLGMERLLTCSEDSLPDGDRFGIWTWGPNGLALARAAISFESSPGCASVPDPGPRLQRMTGGRNEPQAWTRVRNPQPGGFFAHELADSPIGLEHTGVLTFVARFPSDAVLSLLARIRGQTAEMVLSGPDVQREYTVPLGPAHRVPSRQWPGWTEYRADLHGSLRQAFPEGSLTLDRLSIASPTADFAQVAGLGVNRAGSTFDIAELRWLPPGEAPPAAPSQLAVQVHGHPPLDDFESGFGAWERLGGGDGAALYRDAATAAGGRHALRLLNQHVGGPAGAWITREPYPLAAFPGIRFDYRMGPGVEANLLVKANGDWYEIGLTGDDATWPLLGRISGVRADRGWHTATFDLARAMAARFGTRPVTIEAMALADTLILSTWQREAYWIDSFCRVPALDPGRDSVLTLTLGDGGTPTAFSHCVDSLPNTDPGTTATGQGAALTLRPTGSPAWLHLRGQRHDGSWTDPLHLPIVVQAVPAAAPPAPAAAEAAGPPAAPLIAYFPSDRLSLERFDWQECRDDPTQGFGDAAIRREAWLLRGENDGTAGDGCLIIQNLSANGFFSAYLRRQEWDPVRWPMLSFDYRFEQPGCALNLAMLANGAMAIVGWTGDNQRGNHFADAVVGNAPKAIQDGRWHHAVINLGDMLLKSRFPDPDRRGRVRIAELSTWATNHAGGGYSNPHTARLRLDNICVHSNYGNDPEFAWRLPADSAPAADFAVVVDASPNTVPPEVATTRESRWRQPGMDAGVWYIHVRARNDAGWGPTAHRQFAIEAR